MASLLNPYISFDGNAREAIEFYVATLGGKPELNTFAEYGGPPRSPTRSCTAGSTPMPASP